MARAGARAPAARTALAVTAMDRKSDMSLGVNDPEIRKDRLLLGRGPDVASDLDTAQGQVR